MKCQNCNYELPVGAVFCGNCSTMVAQQTNNTAESEVKVQPTPTFQQEFSPPPQGEFSPPPQTEYSPPPQQNWQQFNQPIYNQTNVEPLSIGTYIGMILLNMVPIVGLVLLLVWAFDKSVNLNKRNLAKAMLIIKLIGVVISFIFYAFIFIAISEIISEMASYSSIII